MKHIKKNQAHLNPISYERQQERYKRYQSKPEAIQKARELQRKRRLLNPEKYKAYSRKSERTRKLKKYGLSREEYQILWSKQNECCGICKSKVNLTNRDWHLDHCHSTLKVRGILCHHCNIMLGNARDRIDILEAGILYLKENE